MSMFAEIAASARESHDSFFGTDSGVSLLIPGAVGPEEVPAVLYSVMSVSRRDENGRTQRVIVREVRFPDRTELRQDALVYISVSESVTEVWAIEQITDRSGGGITAQIIRIEAQNVSRQHYRAAPAGSRLGSR